MLALIMEKAMANHSSTLAWKIPWTEEPGGLQSMGSRRVGNNWTTSLSLFTFMHWRRKWQPTPVFLPGESQRQWAPIYGVTHSHTRLKRLSSSSSPYHKYQSMQLFFKHFPLNITSFMIILKDYIMCQINIRKKIKVIEDSTILAGKIVWKTLKMTILFFRPRD